MATFLLLLDQPRYMTMVALREVQKVFVFSVAVTTVMLMS